MNSNKMLNYMADFVTLVGMKLPDDILQKLTEIRQAETQKLAQTVYNTMFLDIERALALKRPLCQDTGVIQFFISCGAEFPYIGQLEDILREAVLRSTQKAPLRHNCVETFDEYNTGTNTGYRAPSLFWDIVPGDKCTIHAYMAGGGCSLPGRAAVLMPGDGYEGVAEFVMDVVSGYGVNACPPLLVGVGVATSVETAAVLSKVALLRPIGSRNKNARAAEMECLLEDGLNHIGIGPQGISGSASVLGVHIENAARHPSTIGVAVNLGCWAHRRGEIVFDRNLDYEIKSHSGVKL